MAKSYSFIHLKMNIEAATVSLATSSSRAISFNELVTIYGRTPSHDEVSTLQTIVTIFNEMVSIASQLDYKIHFRLIEGTCEDLVCFPHPRFIEGYKAQCGRLFNAEEKTSLERLNQLWDDYVSVSRDLFLPFKMEVTYPKESVYNEPQLPISYAGRLTLRL